MDGKEIEKKAQAIVDRTEIWTKMQKTLGPVGLKLLVTDIATAILEGYKIAQKEQGNIDYDTSMEDFKHSQCGADNPSGKVNKCRCACHRGHYRHFWEKLDKPKQAPDGTHYILFRCKYCPDIKYQVIKARWNGERHEIASFSYLIKGTKMVLQQKQFYSQKPEPANSKLLSVKTYENEHGEVKNGML